MANLNRVVYLSEAQKNTLFTTGTVTSGQTTITYDANDLYITPPEYDSVPTANSNHLISSGAVYNAINGLGTGSVTSITPGNGLINGTSGTSQAAITSSGTISLANITRTNNTSTASPAHAGTFTAIDSITTDDYGRVTAVNTKTVTLPSDNNTDTKVNVKARGTTKAYLLATSTSPTSSNQAVESLAETGVYLDTTAGKLVATTFVGALNGNADTATKATQDSDGNAINTTYLKLSGGTMTGDVNFYTSGSGVTPGIVFQRGSLTDNYNDWKIWDEGGYLYFGQRGSNSTSFDKNIYMDNSGSLHANLTGNAATATKATQDGSGNVITSTYIAKPSSASNGNILTYNGTTWTASAPAISLPSGGAAGQVLTKASATDYDASWETPLFERGTGNYSIQSINLDTGAQPIASGNVSLALGAYTVASGIASFAAGTRVTGQTNGATASGAGSIALGGSTLAQGNYSMAIGNKSQATGSYGFAGGYQAQATGSGAFAYGNANLASETAAIALGNQTTASGKSSIAFNLQTIAAGLAQTAIGQYNIEDTTAGDETTYGTGAKKYLFIIGNGTASARSNALTVDWGGNLAASGLALNGVGSTEAEKKVQLVYDATTEVLNFVFT